MPRALSMSPHRMSRRRYRPPRNTPKRLHSQSMNADRGTDSRRRAQQRPGGQRLVRIEGELRAHATSAELQEQRRAVRAALQSSRRREQGTGVWRPMDRTAHCPASYKESDAVKALLKRAELTRQEHELLLREGIIRDREWLHEARMQQQAALKVWRSRDPPYIFHCARCFAATKIQRLVRAYFAQHSRRDRFRWQAYRPDAVRSREAFRQYLRHYNPQRAEEAMTAEAIVQLALVTLRG